MEFTTHVCKYITYHLWYWLYTIYFIAIVSVAGQRATGPGESVVFVQLDERPWERPSAERQLAQWPAASLRSSGSRGPLLRQSDPPKYHYAERPVSHRDWQDWHVSHISSLISFLNLYLFWQPYIIYLFVWVNKNMCVCTLEGGGLCVLFSIWWWRIFLIFNIICVCSAWSDLCWMQCKMWSVTSTSSTSFLLTWCSMQWTWRWAKKMASRDLKSHYFT